MRPVLLAVLAACGPNPGGRVLMEGPVQHSAVTLAPDGTAWALLAGDDAAEAELWRYPEGEDGVRATFDVPDLNPLDDTLLAVDRWVLVFRHALASYYCVDGACGLLTGPDGLVPVGRLGDDTALAHDGKTLWALPPGETTWVDTGLPAPVVWGPDATGGLLLSDGYAIERVRSVAPIVVEPVAAPCLYPTACAVVPVTTLAGDAAGGVWVEAAGPGHLWHLPPGGAPEHHLRVPLPGDEPAALDDIDGLAAGPDPDDGPWIAGSAADRGALVQGWPQPVARDRTGGTWRWTLHTVPGRSGLFALGEDAYAFDIRLVRFADGTDDGQR